MTPDRVDVEAVGDVLTDPDIGEPSPSRDRADLDELAPETTNAITQRLRTRVGALLRKVDRQAHYLLDRELTADEVAEANAAGEALAVLFGRMGLAELARLARNIIEALADDGGRQPTTAIELTATCEDLRSLLDSAIAQYETASKQGGLVVAIGEPAEELDAVCWVANTRGHTVVHADHIPAIEAEPMAIVVVVEGDCDPAIRIQLLAVNKRWRSPLIVLHRDTEPATIRRLARYATTVIPLDTPPREVVDELARVGAADSLELRALTWGSIPEETVDRLESFGFSVTPLDDPDRLPSRLGPGPGAVVLGPDIEATTASEIAHLVRADPRIRHNPIAWITDGVDPDLAPHLDVSAIGELDDELMARLAARLRRLALASIDVDQVENVILEWAAAQVLVDRVLAAAHRTGRQVALATIQLDPELDAGRLAAIDEVFGKEFRIEDILGRRGDRNLVLALAGVPRQVAARRLGALLARLELDDGASRVGVALFPSDGRSATDLVEAADQACARASDHGGPEVVATTWRPEADEVDVLVVDADPVMSQVLVDLLDASGLRACLSPTGPEALSVLQADVDRITPRLLLLDLDVRGIDGLVMLRELRTAGLLPQMKVLVMMARFSEPDQRMALDIGAADVINKPLSGTLLLHRIRLLLGEGP